jgi:WD40 repeat protein
MNRWKGAPSVPWPSAFRARPPPSQAVNHIAFSPDGRYFASASFDKKVKVWDGRTGAFIATLTGHVSAVYQVAWSTDSRLLISASKDSTAKVWDLKKVHPRLARAGVVPSPSPSPPPPPPPPLAKTV